MAEITRTGELSLEITVDFSEPEMVEEFEAALRVWYRQYRRAITTEQMLKGLANVAGKGQSVADGDDVSGYIRCLGLHNGRTCISRGSRNKA